LGIALQPFFTLSTTTLSFRLYFHGTLTYRYSRCGKLQMVSFNCQQMAGQVSFKI